ncbi:hypothetical protein SAMN02746068_01258 [Lactococcus chungangensis CAU 28 = DSM 22330]|uniref:Uncharacterized protein n=2 Tax=Pseudolactococcus chungangensis CAU 28 = DSM 22330 TaxID=1122154 RepID=A0A1K2HCA2_9LACT|nr:hypothetical protein [Lactococcus chungangensis]SFZ74456.1 hypothetical protein SAMN02746068_01258 [Lactococcus chungangensis CAU 28 = DSM 22330]
MKNYRTYLSITLKICIVLILLMLPFVIISYETSGAVDLFWQKTRFYTSLAKRNQVEFISRTDDIISDVCYLLAVLILRITIKKKESMARKVFLFIAVLGIADMLGQIVGLGIAGLR